MEKKLRIGTLISGTGTNLDAILKACETGKIDGRVVFVGSDNPDATGLEKAKKQNIPTVVVNYSEIIAQYKKKPDPTRLPPDFHLEEIRSKQGFFEDQADIGKINTFLCTRAIAEAKLLDKMAEYPFDLLVLAGFMRNLTPYLIDRVNIEPLQPRIMNIHPALLPAFPGTDGYGDTFRYGCRVGGCTVHFIDYGEDSGPIIGQRCFEITEEDTIASIREKGLALEWELYSACIQMFAEGRLHTVRMTYPLGDGRLYRRTVVKIAADA
jgi:phosphoribosylglycinamide formyltransferase 1